MIALFDSNIYIDALTGRLPENRIEEWKLSYILRLSPVVYHELLRGSRNPSIIYEIREKTILFPSPTPHMWEESAEIIRSIGEKRGFSEGILNLQNDLLIALSAREAGALLITKDKHFKEISSFLSFHLLLV